MCTEHLLDSVCFAEREQDERDLWAAEQPLQPQQFLSVTEGAGERNVRDREEGGAAQRYSGTWGIL